MFFSAVVEAGDLMIFDDFGWFDLGKMNSKIVNRYQASQYSRKEKTYS